MCVTDSVVTLSDTDRFRNPRFHKPSDRPETLDYADLERTVAAARSVLSAIARAPEGG